MVQKIVQAHYQYLFARFNCDFINAKFTVAAGLHCHIQALFLLVIYVPLHSDAADLMLKIQFRKGEHRGMKQPLAGLEVQATSRSG